MRDSRIAQIRQEVSTAAACLDDARCAISEIAEEGPRLTPVDAEDFRTVRAAINQALLKVRGANAGLARLEDRAKRHGEVSA